jgi:aspartate dehydrogenase
VGCGAIGCALAQAIERRYANAAKLVAVVDRDRARARLLQQRLASHPPIVSLPTLIRRSHLVIEAASVSAAPRVARLALAANRDVLVMSAGGLLAHRAAWQRLSQRARGRLHVPSGALSGLDGVKAMAVGTITRIGLTTRKPPQALASSPFVRSKRLRLTRLRRPTVLFRGSPEEAIKAFPQNVNVAATLALAAGGGMGSSPRRRPRITVRVVADPTIHVNVHEVDVQGDCGRLNVRVESRPSATNPKTSELAIRSALATLNQLLTSVRIGT